MRILVISNLYPPHHVGGYELGCKDVVEHLKARGHELRVLTSTFGLEQPVVEDHVERSLVLDWSWGGQHSSWKYPYPPRREFHNQRRLKRVFGSFKPDLIYIWNLMYLSTSLALQAERLGVPVFYFVSDKYWSQLSSEDPLQAFISQNFPDPRPLVKTGLRIIQKTLTMMDLVSSRPLIFPRVHFVSEFLKHDALRQRKQANHGEVIPWGIDLDLFRQKLPRAAGNRLLYVGQIAPSKDVATAIEIVRRIIDERGPASVTLSLVGGSVIPAYESEMRRLVQSYRLEENIKFTGPTPREMLADVYRKHDILIFPSLLDEALSITTLEAMACGLPVVATARGGNVEVLTNESNALIFENGDVKTATSHVLHLFDDANLFDRIRSNARKTVEEKFSLSKMVDKIECSLRSGTS